MNNHYYDLTHPQKSIFFDELRFDSLGRFNLGVFIKFDEPIKHNLLEKGVNIVIEMNDGLRIRILPEYEKHGKQYFSETNHEKIDVVNVKETNFDSWFAEFTEKSFDFYNNKLYCFYRVKTDKYEGLYMKFHHVIADATAIQLLAEQVLEWYIKLRNNNNSDNLISSKPSYITFIKKENNYLESSRFLKDKLYWERKLENVRFNELGINNICKFASIKEKVQVSLKQNEVRNITKFCNCHRISILRFWIAITAIYNSKVNMVNNNVLGTTIHNRTDNDTNCMFGMLVNVLPIITNINGEDTFSSMIKKIDIELNELLRHQQYPYDLIVKDYEEKNGYTNNFINIIINYQSRPRIQGFDIKTHYVVGENFPLTINIDAYENDMVLTVHYIEQIFHRDEIICFINTLISISNRVLENEDETIEDIEVVSNQFKNHVLKNFNNKGTLYPKNHTIQELFEETVEKYGERTALVCGGKEISYQELNGRANAVAWDLIGKGIKPGETVGLLVERSVEMIAGILGILKAGGAYLPLDPGFPESRVSHMLEDSEAAMLLYTGRYTEKAGRYMSGEKLLNMEGWDGTDRGNPGHEGTPMDTAYIIYTSGSTGRPKGVVVTHRNVIRLVKNQNYIDLSSCHKILQTGALTFDASTFEIYGALLNGLRLYLYEKDELLIPEKIEKILHTEKIDVLWLTSPLFNQFAEQNPGMFGTLKYLMIGGDVLVPKFVNEVRRCCKKTILVNGYGPTENTTFSLCYPITKEHLYNIPIGKAIGNSTVYILDADGNIQGLNVPGEIYVGGDGVAKGYLNAPELTGERFIEDPYCPGERMYRTGDLGRWLPDGNVEFIGRMDGQVKVRGYRIELGEIESCLRRQEGVQEAVVIAREEENGNRSLCAYLVEKGEVSMQSLRESLAKELPDYMIPQSFTKIDHIPLNNNGKINTKELPDLTNSDSISSKYVAPRTFIENKIVEIWEEVLKKENIGIYDNFFEIGGDSLKALQVVAKLQKEQMKLSVKEIYKYPFVAMLSKHIIKSRVLSSDNIITLGKNSDNNETIADELQLAEREKQKKEYLDTCKNLTIKNVRKKYYNILLLGVTGFLGSNLFKEIYTNTNSNIYLIIRSNTKEDARNRFHQRIRTIFSGLDKEDYDKRVKIICGDLSKNKLGITNQEYMLLAQNIDCIINAAANVRHYGKYQEFYKSNVIAVKNIIELAKIGRKKVINHISTLSVSIGNDRYCGYFIELNTTRKSKFNYYVETKQYAEELIETARKDGVICNIYRVGNLVFDSETGKFQENIYDNNFYKIIKSYIKIGYFPNSEKILYDFSFINYVCKAINLLVHMDIENQNYHVYNPNRISLPKLAKFISNTLQVKIVEWDDFCSIIQKEYSNSSSEYIDNLLLEYDLGQDNKLIQPTLLCDMTNKLLQDSGFTWPEVNERHIKRMLKYCLEIEFI